MTFSEISKLTTEGTEHTESNLFGSLTTRLFCYYNCPMRVFVTWMLAIANVAFNVVSNVGFKKSSLSHQWQGFLGWQIVGNLAGFLSVIAFTFLLRYISMNLALAVQFGIGFVFVQVIGAQLIFKETITIAQWLGVSVIFLGILLVALGRPAG